MSALSGIDIALWDLKGESREDLEETEISMANSPLARRLNVPLFELLGGKVRDKCQVYCWIGGDRPSDIERAA